MITHKITEKNVQVNFKTSESMKKEDGCHINN